jgi:hypothetical protein
MSPMSPIRFVRTAVAAALVALTALIGVLAPQAAAAQAVAAQAVAARSAAAQPLRPALPLPLPGAGVEPIVSEGVTVEGPLINNITLPMLR